WFSEKRLRARIEGSDPVLRGAAVRGLYSAYPDAFGEYAMAIVRGRFSSGSDQLAGMWVAERGTKDQIEFTLKHVWKHSELNVYFLETLAEKGDSRGLDGLEELALDDKSAV